MNPPFLFRPNKPTDLYGLEIHVLPYGNIVIHSALSNKKFNANKDRLDVTDPLSIHLPKTKTQPGGRMKSPEKCGKRRG